MPDNSHLLPGTEKANPVVLRHIRREVRMISVAEYELDGLASPDTSIFLAFFGISVGACIALLITILTVTIDNPLKHASFVAMGWVSAAASLFFGIRVIVAMRATSKRLKLLKEEAK